MERKALMCVDDEYIILMSIEQELKSHFGDRFIYASAVNADEAFSVITDLSDDGISLVLVISDWMMPGMKGDEFLMEVRRRYPHIKTIMITGYSSDAAFEKVRKEEFTDYFIAKPWDHGELISTVEKCTM